VQIDIYQHVREVNQPILEDRIRTFNRRLWRKDDREKEKLEKIKNGAKKNKPKKLRAYLDWNSNYKKFKKNKK